MWKILWKFFEDENYEEIYNVKFYVTPHVLGWWISVMLRGGGGVIFIVETILKCIYFTCFTSPIIIQTTKKKIWLKEQDELHDFATDKEKGVHVKEKGGEY